MESIPAAVPKWPRRLTRRSWWSRRRLPRPALSKLQRPAGRRPGQPRPASAVIIVHTFLSRNAVGEVERCHDYALFFFSAFCFALDVHITISDLSAATHTESISTWMRYTFPHDTISWADRDSTLETSITTWHLMPILAQYPPGFVSYPVHHVASTRFFNLHHSKAPAGEHSSA